MNKLLFHVILLTGMLAATLPAETAEVKKEFHKNWPADRVSSLEIINKFGEVRIADNGSSEVTVDVMVTVEANSDNKAKELLGMIDVNFSQTGSVVKAETEMESGFKSNQKFSINYIVNIPAAKTLNVTNKYGDTFVNRLDAPGSFTIQYGNFSATALEPQGSGTVNLELAYGNAKIGTATNLRADLSYTHSPVTIENVENLDLVSKYSSLNLEKGGKIRIDSKYDNFELGTVQELELVSKYSNTKIGTLEKRASMESGYGGIRIGSVQPGFESISVESSYGQIRLGMNSGYTLDASCNYCGIIYPKEEFSGNRMEEKQTLTLTGKVGSESGGKVFIRSRYGEIRLTE